MLPAYLTNQLCVQPYSYLFNSEYHDNEKLLLEMNETRNMAETLASIPQWAHKSQIQLDIISI